MKSAAEGERRWSRLLSAAFDEDHKLVFIKNNYFLDICYSKQVNVISDATTHPVKAESLFVQYAIIAEPIDIINTIVRSMFKMFLSIINMFNMFLFLISTTKVQKNFYICKFFGNFFQK